MFRWIRNLIFRAPKPVDVPTRHLLEWKVLTEAPFITRFSLPENSPKSLILANYIATWMLTPSSEFLRDLSQKNDWKWDNATGLKVEQALLSGSHLGVGFYRSANPWSAAVAYYDGKKFYFNLRRFDGYRLDTLWESSDEYKRGVASLVATLLHEFAHHAGFTHGDNYWSEEKSKYSVPYYISDNVYKWLFR